MDSYPKVFEAWMPQLRESLRVVYPGWPDDIHLHCRPRSEAISALDEALTDSC